MRTYYKVYILINIDYGSEICIPLLLKHNKGSGN